MTETARHTLAVDSRVLLGMPAFLSTLSTFPDGDTVIRTAISGPLAPFHPVASVLWKLNDRHLDILGSYGHTSAELEVWKHQPIGNVTPSAECAREGQILIYSEDTFLQTFPGLTHIELTSEEVHAYVFGTDPHRIGFTGEVVLAPIQANGMPCGVLGFMTDRRNDWTTHTLSLVTTMCSAIALWMTNSSTVAPERETQPVLLTERQLQILEFVAAGRSSQYIAAHMGYSLSTINQELQRINAAFAVSDRHQSVAEARALGMIHG